MVPVVIGAFAWNSVKFLMMVPESDALVTVLVTVVTVLEDLAVAVIVGVIVSALVYAWKTASRIRAIERPSKTDKGAKVYEIEGPLFFSSANSFLEIFNPEQDPKLVIIDFAKSRVIDQSALKAIEDVAHKYNSFGKKIPAGRLPARGRQHDPVLTAGVEPCSVPPTALGDSPHRPPHGHSTWLLEQLSQADCRHGRRHRRLDSGVGRSAQP